MDQAHKDLIRRNYTKLIDGLRTGIGRVCNELFENGIISSHMQEDILEGHTMKRQQAQALLDLIVTRGPYAFNALYDAARTADLHAVCDILYPNAGSHFHPPLNSTQSGYDSPDDELPDAWPSPQALEDVKNVRLIEKTDKKMLQLYEKSLKPDQDSIYPMRHKQRGRVLVINNEKFDNLLPREGTSKDRMALEKLFRAFKFDVEVHKNLKAEEMRKLLKKEAEADNREADCFVLFILTHGHTGVVFGTDGKQVDEKPQNAVGIKEIRDFFSKAPSLIGKPKLFFIQACQGTSKDSGRPAAQDIADGAGPESNITIKQEDISETMKELMPQEDSDAIGERTSSRADMFIAMATTPDFLSWRNTIHGTWFIQAIVYVFAKYAYRRDLNILMTLVNKLVGKAVTAKGQYKQVGEKTDTFQRTFYFFPGLSQEEADTSK